MIEFIVGLGVGGVGVYLVVGRKGESVEQLEVEEKKGLIERKEEVKSENLVKLREFVEKSDGSIANDQVQELLGVSDATAERYLNELEKSGVVGQNGETGSGVNYYKK